MKEFVLVTYKEGSNGCRDCYFRIQRINCGNANYMCNAAHRKVRGFVHWELKDNSK